MQFAVLDKTQVSVSWFQPSFTFPSPQKPSRTSSSTLACSPARGRTKFPRGRVLTLSTWPECSGEVMMPWWGPNWRWIPQASPCSSLYAPPTPTYQRSWPRPLHRMSRLSDTWSLTRLYHHRLHVCNWLKHLLYLFIYLYSSPFGILKYKSKQMILCFQNLGRVYIV